MRDFKFRAWYPEKQEMSDGVKLLYVRDELSYVYCNFTPVEMVLMQYTGHKDSNGKEIYEGDILKRTNIRGCGDGVNALGRVIHTPVKFFEFHGWCGLPRSDRYDNHEKLEVVGNIYENPELLNNKEDL